MSASADRERDAHEAERRPLRVEQVLVQRRDEALAAEAHPQLLLVQEGELVAVPGPVTRFF